MVKENSSGAQDTSKSDVEPGYPPDRPLYIVVGRRWGSEESHCYIYGWERDKDVAMQMADQLRDDRGGKYAGIVYEVYGGITPFGNRTEVYRRESQAG